jgi:S-adenosylmethionine:tRNA ribosyltransferase-isomerase
VEFLLLGRRGKQWEALGRSGGRLRPGTRVLLEPGPGREGAETAEVLVEGRTEEGRFLLRLPEEEERFFSLYGRPPLPPYVKGELSDPERYQTVYAQVPGSLAAPTAGLHFTPEILSRLRSRGVEVTGVILHLGPFSFLVPPPLPPPPEEVAVEEEAVEAILRCRMRGGRVVAVGTSTVRALETAALSGELRPFSGPTSLFIRPGFRFRVVDGLVTNFHYSGSSHLDLVTALAGEERVRKAYEEARDRGYRFYSFGDAMLVL